MGQLAWREITVVQVTEVVTKIAFLLVPGHFIAPAMRDIRFWGIPASQLIIARTVTAIAVRFASTPGPDYLRAIAIQGILFLQTIAPSVLYHPLRPAHQAQFWALQLAVLYSLSS